MKLREAIGYWLLGETPAAAALAPAPNGALINGVSNSTIPLPELRRGSDAYEMFTGVPAIQGLPVVTDRSALSVAAIWACVNLLAGAVTTLPVNILGRQADGTYSPLDDDPLWWMLNEEFCPRWNAVGGWEWLMLSRLFHGDAFAEILRRGPLVNGLVPLHPLRVEPVPWTDGSRLAYIIWPEPGVGPQEVRVLDQDDVLHVTGLGFNGWRSISPLRYALQMVGGVAIAAQDYSGQFFANQARPDYVLRTDHNLAQPTIDNLREQVIEKHSQQRGQGHLPMVLQGGLDVKTLTLPNKDAELIATRQFQIEDIARIFGVPPFMIGHNEKTTSWGSGVAEMGEAFVRYSLGRHLTAFQTEINRKFFRTSRKIARFDTFELEKADLATLFETFRTALGRAGEAPFMTRDEVRKLINLGKMPAEPTTEEASDAQPTAQPAQG
jgi:HK97 family phage portal protein